MAYLSLKDVGNGLELARPTLQSCWQWTMLPMNCFKVIVAESRQCNNVSRPLPATMCRALPTSLTLLPFYLTVLPPTLNPYMDDGDPSSCQISEFLRLEGPKQGLSQSF